jgi:endonuclease-3
MSTTTSWKKALQPLIKKYKGRKHPLDYQNPYQLLVMVVLSAQDSDRHINKIAPDFFAAYPDMKALAKADTEGLHALISGVRNFRNKTKWLLAIASEIKTDAKIPASLEALTELPGIGRKSANVILRERGLPAEGIIVDLHVVRVAPRLGIATGSDPKKIESQLMDALDKKDWGEAGMAISFLGRETCRPKNPKCGECVVSNACAFFATGQ